MKQLWYSLAYVYFNPNMKIEEHKGQLVYVFTYLNKHKCQSMKIHWYQDTHDWNSTSNMLKHIKTCWGEEVRKAVENAKDAEKAREMIIKPYVQSG